jgi:hypothetical protein
MHCKYRFVANPKVSCLSFTGDPQCLHAHCQLIIIFRPSKEINLMPASMPSSSSAISFSVTAVLPVPTAYADERNIVFVLLEATAVLLLIAGELADNDETELLLASSCHAFDGSLSTAALPQYESLASSARRLVFAPATAGGGNIGGSWPLRRLLFLLPSSSSSMIAGGDRIPNRLLIVSITRLESWEVREIPDKNDNSVFILWRQ